MAKQRTSPVLKVSDLNFRYSGNSENAISNISFELEPKTITMLIGPNGSGKSTLLKVILGILDGKGKINFSNNGDKISRHASHIGYVPQKLTVDTTIPVTVHEFLNLTISSCKRCKSEPEIEIMKALKQVDALQFVDKKIGDLSGGQLQRVVLARALLYDPKLLILDEPEAGIDIQGERYFYEVLKQLVEKRGITALIATHEIEVVNQYADQVLCINKALVCSGSVAQTLTAKTFEKLYGLHTKPYYHLHGENQEEHHYGHDH